MCYFSRSTLCDWVKAIAHLLRPLYDLQRELVLQSSVMWTDDTHVTVLGGEEGSFKGYFWTYIGDAQHPYSVYDFTNSRSRLARQVFWKVIPATCTPMPIPATTRCSRMSDRISSKLPVGRMRGASSLTRCEAIRVKRTKCWSGSSNSMTSKTGPMTCRSRRAVSSAHRSGIPVLDRIEAYLAELAPSALPKSTLGKAVTYARNQWEALRRYTEDGRLTIDNNVSERTLRHQAVGRKNWLFLGSEAAGPRAAVLYTILAGAKRHRIEPWAYVRDLLLRLHADDLRLEEMLPDRWAAAHPEAILNHRLDESSTKAIRTRARRAHRRASTQVMRPIQFRHPLTECQLPMAKPPRGGAPPCWTRRGFCQAQARPLSRYDHGQNGRLLAHVDPKIRLTTRRNCSRSVRPKCAEKSNHTNRKRIGSPTPFGGLGHSLTRVSHCAASPCVHFHCFSKNPWPGAGKS